MDGSIERERERYDFCTVEKIEVEGGVFINVFVVMVDLFDDHVAGDD